MKHGDYGVGEGGLAAYLKELRMKSELSLRDMERATGGLVSNAYLSQLETGKRRDPHPRMLVALAKVYGIPWQLLFEKAGFVDAIEPSAVDVGVVVARMGGDSIEAVGRRVIACINACVGIPNEVLEVAGGSSSYGAWAFGDLCDQIDTLEVRLAKAERLLRVHVRGHDRGCALRIRDGACDCGYGEVDAFLAESEAQP